MIVDAPDNNLLVFIAVVGVMLCGILLDNGYVCTALASFVVSCGCALLLWVRHEKGLFM
jgi:hypothetical protein